MKVGEPDEAQQPAAGDGQWRTDDHDDEHGARRSHQLGGAGDGDEEAVE